MESGGFSLRHALAFFVTFVAAVMFWYGTHLVLSEADKTPHTPVMHVSLARPPAPPAPTPPKVVPKPPKPVVQKRVASRTPRENSPHGTAPPASNAPVSNKDASPTPPAPPAPPAPSEDMSAQNTYFVAVRAAVEEQKRYPDSKDARLQQPSGTVIVWFTLDRTGQLLDSGIEQSAGSILDRAARDSVRRATFPPFPSGAWPGESQHRFSVDLKLHP